MKKLMILGAAASQVPLISAAKRLGYETIVTSIPGDYPGFTYADVCCYADISKPEEMQKILDEGLLFDFCPEVVKDSITILKEIF